MVQRRAPILAACVALVAVLVAVCVASLQITLPSEIERSLEAAQTGVIVACALPCALGFIAVVLRMRNRRRRQISRYQLVLSQSDEAGLEDVASCCEQLVQTMRVARIRRIFSGQPWLAIESWFMPAGSAGETGTAALMLVCEPAIRDSALAALRHAYPDLTLRGEDGLGGGGDPLERLPKDFVADHVMRVRKARSWALPIGASTQQGGVSNARSTLAAIIRQQQQGGRLSCVRWCLLPAAERLDSRATQKLEDMEGERRGAALATDVTQASRTAGGAMCFLEMQAAVQSLPVRRALRSEGRESFMTLHAACRQLLSPALSQRGANHLRERLMLVRQRLYQRRWERAEPPLLPDPTGATLLSPRELALLMALPSLGSEHALPLQRNTIPHLPIPVDVPRARLVELPQPPASVTALRGADGPYDRLFT